MTVVVTMLFVMALGAALLFAAYTAYTIRITERADSENFYNASTAMDEIKAGIQTQVTQAIAEAYTNVITTYTSEHEADYNPQVDFNNQFIKVLASKTVTVSGSPVNMFTYSTSADGKSTVISGYNPIGIKALIDTQYQDSSKVNDATAGDGIVSENSVNGVLTSISLKSISLKFVDVKDYESDITTDITINMPDFFAGSSITSSINNSALIANNGLIQSEGGPISVDGDIFIGNGGANVSGSGNKLTLNNGTVLCKGPISIGNSAAFKFDAAQKELWAGDIRLGPSATAFLNGKVYVANDLVMSGGSSAAKTSATLQGTYFGFGDSSTDPSSSSSILINGRNTNLDISKLDKLSLAGVSFIDISNKGLNSSYNASDATPDTSVNPIMMGESMSVKTDQLAYLVPEKCITNFASNPCVFGSGATSTDYTPIVDDESTVLWGTGTASRTLSYYIDNDKGKITTLYKNAGGGLKIAYVLLVFSSKRYANEYFKDYFTADPSRIELYQDLYLTLSDKADDALINTAGNSFYNDDNNTPSDETDDKLTLIPASDRIYAEGYNTRFSSMKSPYSAYVNKDELDKLNKTFPAGVTLEFKDTATNETVAVISTASNYDYASDSSGTIRLIISTNDVTINQEFNGVAIAGKNIILKKSVTAKLLDTNILDATCTIDDGTVYKLSAFLGGGLQQKGSGGTVADAWDLDSLVFYENWAKK